MDCEARGNTRVMAAVPAYGARYADIVRKSGLGREQVDAILLGLVEARLLKRWSDGRYFPAHSLPKPTDVPVVETAEERRERLREATRQRQREHWLRHHGADAERRAQMRAERDAQYERIIKAREAGQTLEQMARSFGKTLTEMDRLRRNAHKWMRRRERECD